MVSSLLHLNFFRKCNLHHDKHLWQKIKSSVTRVSLTRLGFFSYVYRLHCSKKLQASVHCEQFHISHCIKLFGGVWVFFFLKYCGSKFINSQNVKTLKYWLAQLLITGCSYRELEEPPMGFLLQQYCTYYMNKLHCCIMQLLHHQFRE